MTRMFLVGICIAGSLAPLACRGNPDPSSSPAQRGTTINVENWETAPPDPNYAVTLKQHTVRHQTATSVYETLKDHRILRFENSLVSIVFDVEDVIGTAEKHFAATDVQRDKALADRLRSEAGIGFEYRYEDFPWRERCRLYFCVAALLEEGKFVATVNDTKEKIREISILEYSWIRGPTDGVGGRMFLLDDGRAFFITTDVIY